MAPPRHTPRQNEILRTLDPLLRAEFSDEEFKQIDAWFDYMDKRVKEALDGMVERLTGRSA